ncbi:hypothetical protein AB0C91_10200 [Streptomyces sp. NPDC048674]|uniref:hypothetical protein n=1 Tax=Streptomyces sp. NPDC048674 TaxID=3155491 RepID=UPI003420D5AA
MSGRTWEPTRKGAKDLNRWLRKGKTVYTLRNVSGKFTRYEDAQLYVAHTFDRRSMFTAEWMTGHLSASGLLAQEGTVYELPPENVRNIATPGRQYAAPTGKQALDRLTASERRKAGSRR